ncbi:glycosyltransferase family 1 protein [Ornithinimicrobium faecis]|uniref:glycosyltransferase family 1 protein n=1 Tax=Ornithinimicrobium faecis TaxID=2934158 RepID=UPI0021184E00|nr:glycosyltransferase family 1 protein [Ornithinimicrobium sp. HY1745]
MDERPSLLIIALSTLVSDARVLRQIRLFTDDYAVTTVGYGPAPEGVVEHIAVPDEIISWHLDRRLVVLRRYQPAYDTAPVIRHLAPRLEPGRWDVVLANDVETVPLAVNLLPRGGVHADLHEYASRQNEESRRWRWFVAPYRRWLVRTWVSRAASVTTVGAILAAEYQREFGIEAGVVPNAAPYADRSPTPVGDPLRLVHSGAARRNRSLGVMLDAVRLTQRPVTLDLYLVPNDPAYLEELQTEAADLPQVRFNDPVPPGELVERLGACDVGVFVLPPLTFNYLNTLPNKFFDFIQARLGIVVGPSPEMSALVDEHGLGVVTSDFTAESLARALDDLTPEDVERYKAASHAVARELSAEQLVQGWVHALGALAERGSDQR